MLQMNGLDKAILLFSIKNNVKTLFHRESTRYSCIDGLRAFSVLAIILVHAFIMAGFFLPNETFFTLAYHTNWSWVFKCHFAVDIFFVISGFLIANMLMSEHKKTKTIQFKRFYFRRYLRLMPIYYVVILFWMNFGINTDTLWANLIYINNFIPENKQYLVWCWSLGVEEQFYLIFPVILWALLKINNKKRVLFWLISFYLLSFVVICSVVIHADLKLPIPVFQLFDEQRWGYFFNNWYMPTYMRLGSLICGVIVAYLHCYYPNFLKNSLDKNPNILFLSILLAITLMMMIVLFPTLFDENFSKTVSIIYLSCCRNIFALTIAILILACLYPVNFLARAINRFLSLKCWYPIAQLSYSVFLLHPIVCFFIYPSIFSQNEFSTFELCKAIFLVYVATFIVSLVTYLFIEKPLMNLREYKIRHEIEPEGDLELVK
jgi:peptidoglycan/LPS O-acetylase OafA/YrhL